MEVPNDNTLVIQNPDGFIQLGLQSHLRKKRICACYNCKKSFQYNVDSVLIQCIFCRSINRIQNGNGIKFIN